ncbi:MAG: hypothetical protein K0U36_02665, partial [Alphaproteobacteria bacterium]|nr:hypothetical protein [Alphaproteobacteria bacterium]
DADGYSKLMVWAVPLGKSPSKKAAKASMDGYLIVPKFIPMLGEHAAALEPVLRMTPPEIDCQREDFPLPVRRALETTSFDVLGSKDSASHMYESGLAKPHPAARLLMELHKHDTVAFPATDEMKQILTIKESPPPTPVTVDGKSWILTTIVSFSQTNNKLSFGNLNDASKKSISRYIKDILTKYGMHRCHVSPSGQVTILSLPRLRGRK